MVTLFLSTPSARRATKDREPERDRLEISIHALREEGDQDSETYGLKTTKFLSTPSARRATQLRDGLYRHLYHFYPRPPRGGRPGTCRPSLNTKGDFYPRPPRGGRRRTPRPTGRHSIFLSTPSARRATAKTETKSLFSNKLYNILHEFRRALIYNGSKNYPNHAKRLKNPVRRCRKNAENSSFAPGRKTQNNSRPSCSKGG